MLMGEKFKKAPSIRPMLNIGCLMDIPTGRYRKGKHGESILNGGLSYMTGIGGIGNTFKSTLGHYMALQALARYTESYCNVYDTEISLTMDRLATLSKDMECIGNYQLEESERLILTDKTIQTGNDWFESFKEYTKAKRKDAKKHMRDTPFVDSAGEHVPALRPDIFEIDSLSQMDTEGVLNMLDKNEIGSSGLNMEAMKGAAAKSQMLNQMPGLTGSSGAYLIMTAHVGDVHQLDPYSPKKKKLGYMKGDIKFKNVPEKFTFLTNNCWQMLNSKALQNQGTKGAEYPRHKDDVLVGDTDLNVVQLMNLRGKSGTSGIPFELIFSQSEGLLPSLSEFNFIKKFGKYGIGGNDRSYYLEFMPEVTLSRTTVRGKLSENEKLRRAVQITSELCQMNFMWSHLEPGILREPQELFETLKAKGYCWDTLLNDTRGFWIFNDQKHDKHFLSTMDLLNMCRSADDPEHYHPYWYDDLAKERGLKPIELSKTK